MTHHSISFPFCSAEIILHFGHAALLLLLSLNIILISIFRPGIEKRDHGWLFENKTLVKPSSIAYSRFRTFLAPGHTWKKNSRCSSNAWSELARDQKAQKCFRLIFTSHDTTMSRGINKNLPRASSNIIGSFFQLAAKPLGAFLRVSTLSTPSIHFLNSRNVSSIFALRCYVSLTEKLKCKFHSQPANGLVDLFLCCEVEILITKGVL